MKRSYLRKQGKSETAKVKDKIQKTLTQLVRARDGGCVMRHYPESGACSGPTAADHIISRQYSATYGDSRNVVALCQRHHIYWKPQNPILYVHILRRHLGETWDWIERAQLDKKAHRFTPFDWELLLRGLKQELEQLSTEEGVL